MANKLFATSGTLAPAVPTVVDIQVSANGFTPGYVEVHNHSPTTAMTVTLPSGISGLADQSFYIPAGTKAQIPGPISTLSLLSAGANAYSVYGGENKEQLPSLEGIQQGNVTSTVSPMDNVTLEDTGIACRIKDVGVSTAKLANQAVNTAKLADLAVNFNKTGSGVHQNPGQGAAFLLDSSTAVVGNTVTITFNAVAVVYEFTNGGAPGPGNIGVDLPTINVDFPAKVLANQPLISFNMTAAVGFCGVANQALVQAGTTLSVAANGTQVVSNLAATAESRTGIEYRTLTVDANMAANYAPIFYTGTLLFALAFSSTAGDVQLTPVGLGYLPLATGDGIAVSTGVAGTKLHVILFLQY